MLLTSNTSLSPTVAPLVGNGCPSIPAALRKLAENGINSVQLSAAQQGIRPRELDRRARRDLSATLVRNGLMLNGLDLMIPRKHWRDGEQMDRAVTSALAAIELAADLGHVPVSLALPVKDLADDVRQALLTAADGRNVTLAVHAENELDELIAWVERESQPILGIGIAPSVLLAAEIDPADMLNRFSKHIRVARLDDYSPPSVATMGGRCPVGQGELDVTAYRIAVELATGIRGVVLELRDLSNPLEALLIANQAWQLR